MEEKNLYKANETHPGQNIIRYQTNIWGEKLGTTCTRKNETGMRAHARRAQQRTVSLSQRTQQRTVSHRKSCLIGCMIASNSYTTLASACHTVYQGP